LFVGVGSGTSQFADQIRFATVRRPPFGLLGGSGGRVVITYSLDVIPEQPKVFMLRRDEVPIARPGSDDTDEIEDEDDFEDALEDEGDEEGLGLSEGPQPFSVPVLDNVAGLRFRYLDGLSGQWVNDWDSTEPGDVFGRIPLAVDVVLYLYDADGGLHDFATLVDLPLSPRPTPRT
jgi:hypothetical protein